jgi:hypothetical protein
MGAFWKYGEIIDQAAILISFRFIKEFGSSWPGENTVKFIKVNSSLIIYLGLMLYSTVYMESTICSLSVYTYQLIDSSCNSSKDIDLDSQNVISKANILMFFRIVQK